jgi:hypothetical protein
MGKKRHAGITILQIRTPRVKECVSTRFGRRGARRHGLQRNGCAPFVGAGPAHSRWPLGVADRWPLGVAEEGVQSAGLGKSCACDAVQAGAKTAFGGWPGDSRHDTTVAG